MSFNIQNVTHIYHYDVPKTDTEYIHRIGRTARAGANGTAVTLLTEPDHDNFRRVQSNEEYIIEKADIPDFKKVSFSRKTKKRKHTSFNNHWNNNRNNNNRNNRNNNRNNQNRNYGKKKSTSKKSY